MNEKYAEYTDDRLKSLQRSKDRTRRWGTLCLAVAAALGLLTLLAAVDYWFVFPSQVRVGGWILMVTLVGLGLAWLVRRLRASSTTKDIALELERRRPELGCELSTAAEYLPGGRPAKETYEPEMVAALQEYAARQLVAIETPWWRWRLLVCSGFASGTALAVVLALALVPGGKIAALRVLVPWNPAVYTTFEIKPGNDEVVAGTDQEIEVLTTGKLLRAARLEWKTNTTAEWQYAALQRVNSHRFLGTLPCVTGEITYRVTSRDAHSSQFTLTSFTPPAYKKVRVRVTPPAYTREAAHEESSADLTVLRASRLDYEFLTAGKVTDARLRFAEAPLVPLVRYEENHWTNSIVATHDTYYWVDLVDNKGRKGGNDKAFMLTVVQDEKPVVDVIEPGMDIRAEPTNKVTLTISATDDYGVRDLRLIFRKMNGPWHTNHVALPKGEAKNVETTNLFDLAPLGLKEYEVAAYYVEAGDNNTLDGPGIGKSPVYFVEYTTNTLGQCHGSSSKINLIEFEKQIIAATTALPDSGEENKYRDIAGFQRQTKTYGLIYQGSPLLAIAPEKAREEFQAALEAMDQVSTRLDAGARSAALTSEESALQHLYETCRLLPDLEAGMCRGQGNCVKIVLEAIEKIKEQQKKERSNALPQIIQQARRLIQLQQRLAGIYSGLQPEQTNSSNTNATAATAAGINGNLSTNQPAKNGNGSGELETASEQQRELAEAAAMLSQKLADLSGKDHRVSYRYSGMARHTSELWIAASTSLSKGEVLAARSHGSLGVSTLQQTIDALEMIYGEASPANNTAVEEYPKDFEAQITDYLRRLSYAE